MSPNVDLYGDFGPPKRKSSYKRHTDGRSICYLPAAASFSCVSMMAWNASDRDQVIIRIKRDKHVPMLTEGSVMSRSIPRKATKRGCCFVAVIISYSERCLDQLLYSTSVYTSPQQQVRIVNCVIWRVHRERVMASRHIENWQSAESDILAMAWHSR